MAQKRGDHDPNLASNERLCAFFEEYLKR